MNIMRMATTALILCLAYYIAPAQGVIKVTFADLESNEGQVFVCLFNQESGFPGKMEQALRVEKVAVADRQARYTFGDLPLGTYAVSVMHDRNDDGDIEKNFMGMPKEKVGISNVTGGRPTFEKAAFALTTDEPTVALTIKPFN